MDDWPNHIWFNNSFYGKGGCIFLNEKIGISMGKSFHIGLEIVEVTNSFVEFIGTISKKMVRVCEYHKTGFILNLLRVDSNCLDNERKNRSYFQKRGYFLCIHQPLWLNR